VSVNKRSAKLKRLTVKLPHGLRFRHHTAHGAATVNGVVVKGARARSARLSHGRLVLKLRKAARRVTVTLGPRSLKESKALRAKARGKQLKRLKLEVAVMNAKRKSHALTVTIRKLHLS
jgi:hypothetical protein